MEVQTGKTKEQRRTGTQGLDKKSRFTNKNASGEAEVRYEMLGHNK